MQRLRSAPLAAAVLVCGATASQAEDMVARGAYLVRVAGCNDCHTPGALLGQPDFAHALSGSDVGFMVPGLGVRWGPNLTPDKETGLGNWSDADVLKALREGVTPTGTKLIPIMPYMAFAGLTDTDANAIVAFLRSLPPTHHAVPAPVGPNEKATAPFMAVMMPQ